MGLKKGSKVLICNSCGNEFETMLVFQKECDVCEKETREFEDVRKAKAKVKAKAKAEAEAEAEAQLQKEADALKIFNPLLIQATDLPPGWRLDFHNLRTAQWSNQKRKQTVMASVEEHEDNRWAHVSIAGKNRLPKYEDLCYMKRHWLGEDAKAIQIFPPKSQHVSIHDKCLHLWMCMDDDVLPDFTKQIMGVNVI